MGGNRPIIIGPGGLKLRDGVVRFDADGESCCCGDGPECSVCVKQVHARPVGAAVGFCEQRRPFRRASQVTMDWRFEYEHDFAGSGNTWMASYYAEVRATYRAALDPGFPNRLCRLRLVPASVLVTGGLTSVATVDGVVSACNGVLDPTGPSMNATWPVVTTYTANDSTPQRPWGFLLSVDDGPACAGPLVDPLFLSLSRPYQNTEDIINRPRCTWSRVDDLGAGNTRENYYVSTWPSGFDNTQIDNWVSPIIVLLGVPPMTGIMVARAWATFDWTWTSGDIMECGDVFPA